MIRAALGRRLYRHLVTASAPLTPVAIEQPAIVFAPHPDDETLGCGGLVALKRAHRVPVAVVFMTDGAGSHGARVGRSALAARRRDEALLACERLGVDAAAVRFLDVPDGHLAEQAAAAVRLVEDIVTTTEAAQLVVPHPLEPPSDHAATFAIVAEAIRRRAEPCDALLYPVWLWDQWPLTNPLAPPRGRTARRDLVLTPVRHRLGLGLRRLLTHRLDISSVLDQKRSALAAHVTQMEHPFDTTDWPTLGEVAHGEWLDLLLRPTEMFGIAALGDPGGAPSP